MVVTRDLDVSMSHFIQFTFQYGCTHQSSPWPREYTVLLQVLVLHFYLYLYNTNSVCLSVCLSVKYRRPNCWTDHDQIWHAYADRSGDGSYLKKLTPHPRGVELGILGGSKNQKSGKCHELSRKYVSFVSPPTPSHGVGGLTFQSKSGKRHELPRKLIFFKPPRPPIPSHGGGR